MKICALTTTDNPYDYFKNPDEWASYESFTGGRVYNMLGRFVYTSDALSYEQNAKEVERAIDDIVRHDPIGVFKKVITEVPDP